VIVLNVGVEQFKQDFGLVQFSSSGVWGSEQMLHTLGLLQNLRGCPNLWQFRHLRGLGIWGGTYPIIIVVGNVVVAKVKIVRPDSCRR